MKGTEHQLNIVDSQQTLKPKDNKMIQKNDNQQARSSYQETAFRGNAQRHLIHSQTINKEAYLQQRITKLQTIIKWFQQRQNHKDQQHEGEKQSMHNQNWEDQQIKTKRKSPKMFKYSQFAYENRDRDFDFKAKTQRKGLQLNNRVFSLSKLKLQSTTVNFTIKQQKNAKSSQTEQITLLRKKIENLEEENRKLIEENWKNKKNGSLRQKVDEQAIKVKLNQDKNSKNRFRGHIRKQSHFRNQKDQITTSQIYSKKHEFNNQFSSHKNIRIKKSDHQQRQTVEQRKQTQVSKQYTEKIGLKQTERDILIPQKDPFLNEFREQNTSKQLLEIKLQNIKYDFTESDLQIDFPELPPTPKINYNENMLSQLAQTVFALFDIEINRQNLIKIMKFKNGVIFNISNQNNIVWQYDGKFFIGNWWVDHINHTCGEKNGKGLEYVPNQYIYEGEFKNNLKQGKGKMKMLSKNQFYNGQWIQGQKHGYGVQIDQYYIYQGGWRYGKKHGIGRVTSKKSKYLFQGTFIKGKKNGFGSELFETEDYYTGQYLDDKFHGKGTYIWRIGAIYEGEFLMGLRHGRGIWKSQRTNGDLYEGQYKNNMKNGYGIYKWEDGSQYHGYFKDDMQHGQGKLIPPSGQTISCIWQEGKPIQTRHGNKIHFNIKSLTKGKSKSRQKSARISNSKFC